MQDISISALVDEYGEQGIDEMVRDLGIRKIRSFKCIFPDHKDKSPSMGRIRGTFKFYCQGCQRTYDILNHYQKHHGMSTIDAINELKDKLGYNYEITTENVKKRVEEERKGNADLEKLKDMFSLYDIPMSVLQEEKVDNRSNDEHDIIGLTYRDEEGEFKSYQEIRIDDLSQRMKPEENLLYNYNNIRNEEKIIICFDVIDYLTLKAMGYDNVCAKSSKGNGFVPKYFDKLTKHKEIKLIFGSDVSSQTFDAIAKRIGVETVKYFKFDDFATVAEAKMCGEDIEKALDKAKYIEVPNLKKMEDIKFEVAKQKPLRFGEQSGALSKLDWLLDGVRESTVTLIFGRDNEGKTTITQQIMSNVIEQGSSVFLFDGESNEATLKRKFYLKMIGNDSNAIVQKKINIRPIQYPKPTVVNAIEKWHENKLILKGVGSNHTLFEDMKIAYRRYETKVFVIDNLMSLLTINGNQSRNMAQSQMVQKLKDFAKALGVHIILVAHARETEENIFLSKADVSGSKEITDKVDNVVSFMRDFKERHATFSGIELDPEVTNIMEVLKNRDFGEFGKFYFQFNKNTGNYDEIITHNGEKEILSNNYNWKKYLRKNVNRKTYEVIGEIKDEREEILDILSMVDEVETAEDNPFF